MDGGESHLPLPSLCSERPLHQEVFGQRFFLPPLDMDLRGRT
uniref:Uncharacterized protein n=1 Tax=Arundo donax TaxID=35708 RepID=A0A0A9E3X4_ARUDO